MSPSPEPRPAGRFARAAPALGLFFLSPLVAEFLLGNLPITWIGTLLVLAPLYGGGAVLVREVSRRFGLSWAGIVLLGLAYGVVEEGFVTGSLFNPNYLGLRLLDYGYLPALGVSHWWTVYVLTLHMIWSISVPIALIESLNPGRRETPWLGRLGLGLTTVVFVLGCLACGSFEWKKGFFASPAQYACAALVVAGLSAVSFTFLRRKPARAPGPGSARAPSPLVAGLLSLGIGSLVFLLAKRPGGIPAAANTAAMILLLVVAAAIVRAWSRRAGWSERHRLSLAAGFVLTYAWHTYFLTPSVGHVSRAVDLAGDIVFSGSAVLLIAFAMARVRKEPAQP